MKRLFIIFFLTSIGLYAQVHKDSVSSIDSITKLALTKKIKLLQTKLDSIIKNEKKDEGEKRRVALESCPGIGSCGGMFTYNTMQTFIAVLGMQPLHMVSPASEDERRIKVFPQELIDFLSYLIKHDIKPRDIVCRDSIRNAIISAISTSACGLPKSAAADLYIFSSDARNTCSKRSSTAILLL